jgi:predicted DNA-binding transcriptional regulator AlpA
VRAGALQDAREGARATDRLPEPLAAVAALRMAISEAPASVLPDLIGELEAAKAAAWARLTMPAVSKGPEGSSPEDCNLDADEAARRLGMSRDWLYKNASRLPFAVRIGRRVLFSSQGLERWNRSRTAR